MGGIATLRLPTHLAAGCRSPIRNCDHPRLAIQFEKELDLAVIARLADRIGPHCDGRVCNRTVKQVGRTALTSAPTMWP
ncbi:hypothetical protein LMTR13_25950 [Bradyrhizobium icense]|uniref:Uncharacterized protein n=1 Tax=Bradyrhizobium icense TaxID=1274631 RepID=A0A1B1UK38_9BRAD|nr:hypothetical protein LMTR13_25950 [Bradyrhizobium icense]